MESPGSLFIEPHPAGNIRVSCLMVVLPVPERLAMTRTSIAHFCRQTHANKDLVLVMDIGEECIRQELRDHVRSLGRDDIHVFAPSHRLTLGELRNFSREIATGDVFCQWDDDDLYHPRRLERQLAVLLGGGFEAVYLQEVMQYFPDQNALYWTNWRNTEAASHPGTLMVRRDVPVHYPTRGEVANLGEDSAVARDLILRGCVGYLANEPHLYVYMSHGKNSWPNSHHHMLADKLSISQGLLRRREAQIREGLAAYDFSRNGASVLGSNGLAFTL